MKKQGYMRGGVLFVIDREHRIIEWSELAADLFGVSAEEALGRPCYSVVLSSEPFKHCKLECPVFRAHKGGYLEVSCSFLSRGLNLSRMRVKLTPLPPPGGAIARLVKLYHSSPDIIRDLSGLTILTTTLTPQDIGTSLYKALRISREIIGAEAAEICLTDHRGEEMLLTAFEGRCRGAFLQQTRFKAGEDCPGLVLARKEPVVITDLGHDACFLRTKVKEKGFHTCLCVPLPGPEGVIGSLDIISRRPDIDRERALQILSWARVSISTVLRAAFLQLREGVRDIGKEIDQNLLRSILRYILASMDAEGAAALLFDLKRREIICCLQEGNLSVPFCSGAPGGNCSAMKGEAVILHGPRSSWSLPCRGDALDNKHVVYCLPLTREQPLGVIQVLCRREISQPLTGKLRFLMEIAEGATSLISLFLNYLEAQRHAESIYRQWLQLESKQVAEERATPYLEIRCFGQFEVYRQGLLLTPKMFPRRAALTLLKILLTCRKPVSEDALIELLWPETSPEHGKNLLYVTVHALRHTIDFQTEGGSWNFVKRGDNSYYFDINELCRLDVQEFEAWICLGRKAEERGEIEVAIDAYEKAIGLYRGDFLEDEPYAEWCLSTRQHLTESYFEVVKRLTSLCKKINAWERAIKYLRRALEIDPLREELYQELIYCLWAVGRRDEALRQYQRCRKLLQEELNLSPLPKTEHLAALIHTFPTPSPNSDGLGS